jgi:hypothetical protein
MSTRTTLRPYVVLNGASMAANQTSSVTVLQSLSMLSYALSWTGTSPVGTISVQTSNDYQANGNVVLNAGTWNTLPLTLTTGSTVTAIPISGNTGNGMIDLMDLPDYAIRLIYTAGSGTGALTVTVNGKVK